MKKQIKEFTEKEMIDAFWIGYNYREKIILLTLKKKRRIRMANRIRFYKNK